MGPEEQWGHEDSIDKEEWPGIPQAKFLDDFCTQPHPERSLLEECHRAPALRRYIVFIKST